MAKNKTEDLQIRRAPKYLAFIILGAVLGFITALILNSVATGTTKASITGYLIVFCTGLGIGVGVIAALVIDRVLRSKSKVVKAEVSR
ncbi:MAG: hypothetical protein RIT51_109 [Actinomycetota bacterium]|jgi:multisubunit Na+/H+ antiporter MnhB subunit